MKLHDLRAEDDRRDDLEAAVREFFERFAAGDAAGARRWVDPGFRWFGRDVGEAAWQGSGLAEYLAAEPMSAGEVRAFPRDVLERLSAGPEGLADGALREGDQVFLVDFTRGGRAVTAGVVAGPGRGGARVRRVFDPEPLKAAVEAELKEG